MEVDASRQTKRKRSPETSSFPGKKRKSAYLVNSAKGEVGREREQVRSEARSLYKAYEVLVRTGDAAASEEKRRSSLGVVFKAAEGGSLAGKRLAARIIPRFMKGFPEELTKTVESLLGLLKTASAEAQSQQQHKMLLEGLRRDAMEGIGKACDQAIETMDKPEQLLGKVVHCLIRQVSRPHIASQHGSGANGMFNQPSDCSLMLSSIEKAFRKAPREVVMECLHAWRDGDTVSGSGAGATIVFDKLLLAEKKAVSEVDYNSQRYGYSNGSETCLAIEVLSKNPEMVQWLGQTVYGILQGAGACPRSYHALLEELMRKLPVHKQETFHEPNDAQHLMVHNSRHTPYHGSSPSRSMHVKQCGPQPGIPRRQPSDTIHISQWNKGVKSGCPHRFSFFLIKSDLLRFSNEVDNPVGCSLWVAYLPMTALPSYDDGPCVWFAMMPQLVRKESLGEFCSNYGHVTSVIFPPSPCHDKALVVFGSSRQASICCHHVLNSRGLSGGCRICATVPAAGNPCHSREPISTCIWVGGTPSQSREQEVMSALLNSNLPMPRHMIVINGGHNCPGYVLELRLLRLVNQTLECLEPIDMQHYEQDIPPPAPPTISQVDASHSHSRPREKAWKMPRSQQKTALPPGTWGSRSGDLPSLNTLQIPPPPPPPYPAHVHHVPKSQSGLPQPSPVAPTSNNNAGVWKRNGTENLERSARVTPDGGIMRVGSSPRRLRWAGTLAKSGDNLCKIKCWESLDLLRWGSAPQEPQEWPETLDVRLRVDLNTALKSVDTRGGQSLLFLSAADSQTDLDGLKGFIQYLMDRMRAGVVQLRGNGDGDGLKGPNRTLYLIPPTRSVAKALDIDIGSESTLIVLVIPDVCQTDLRGRKSL